MRLVIKAALAVLLSLPAFAQTPRPAAPSPAAPPSVSAPARPAPAATPAPAGGKVDINAATEGQLEALPGIGPVRSKAIIAGRPYEELHDLVKKKVLTQGVFDGTKSRLALANINTSTAGEMAKTLPGVGEVRSKAIVAARPFAKPEDLVAKGVLTQAVFDKMKDVIAF